MLLVYTTSYILSSYNKSLFLSHNFPITIFPFVVFWIWKNSDQSDWRMATEHITSKADEYSVELLPTDDDAPPPPLSTSWRLSLETFRLPSSTGRHDGRTRFSRYFRTPSEFCSSCFSFFLCSRDLCSFSFVWIIEHEFVSYMNLITCMNTQK